MPRLEEGLVKPDKRILVCGGGGMTFATMGAMLYALFVNEMNKYPKNEVSIYKDLPIECFSANQWGIKVDHGTLDFASPLERHLGADYLMKFINEIHYWATRPGYNPPVSSLIRSLSPKYKLKTTVQVHDRMDVFNEYPGMI